MSEFEEWFADQDFYTNMRFIHGDALFTKDGDVYRVLPVLIAFESWFASACTSIDHIHRLQHEKAKQQSEIDQLKAEKSLQEMTINQVSQANQGWQRLNIEKEKEVEKLKAEKAGLEKERNKANEKIDRIIQLVHDHTPDYYLDNCIQDILRGEHE